MKAWTYIVTNKYNKVLYTGVTSNLKSRTESHKTKKYPNAFTAKYNCNKLVWFEEFNSILDANARERQVKAGNRKRKLKLIEDFNPNWNDLSETLKEARLCEGVRHEQPRQTHPFSTQHIQYSIPSKC